MPKERAKKKSRQHAEIQKQGINFDLKWSWFEFDMIFDVKINFELWNFILSLTLNLDPERVTVHWQRPDLRFGTHIRYHPNALMGKFEGQRSSLLKVARVKNVKTCND